MLSFLAYFVRSSTAEKPWFTNECAGCQELRGTGIVRPRFDRDRRRVRLAFTWTAMLNRQTKAQHDDGQSLQASYSYSYIRVGYSVLRTKYMTLIGNGWMCLMPVS